MTYGFVYMLRNDYMPDVVKIGCTERSPHRRAAELSKATGVPTPFQVVCYIEVRDHERCEREIHDWLSAHRVPSNREFFSSLRREEFLVGIFRWHPEQLAFTEVNVEGCFIGVPAHMVSDPFVGEPPPGGAETEEPVA